MNNKTTSESDAAARPEAGARKVGTYDMPEDRSAGLPDSGTATRTTPGAATGGESGGSLNWLWWLLGLIILIALVVWAFNFFNFGAGPTNPPVATPTPVAAIINLLAL